MTGIILAGGASRRLGRNKALEPWRGQPLVQHVVDRLRPTVNEVLVVGGQDPGQYEFLKRDGLRVVADIYPGTGSLGGIYTGLHYSRQEVAGAVACDMPFVSTKLLAMMEGLAEGFDVVVPRVDGQIESLHAVYRRSCLPSMEKILEHGPARIISFFDQVRVRYLESDEVAAVEPNPYVFLNINTEDDLGRAEAAETWSDRGDPTPR